MSNDNGSYIVTYTGRQFFPLMPHVDDICIEDIAHALSNICRFTGHVREFYSVAEHSVRMSWLAPAYLERIALLHDASEAYLSDINRPLKHSASLAPYREIEQRVMTVIGKRFNIEPYLFADAGLHHLDNRMLWTEKRDLLANASWGSTPESLPFPQTIKPWTPAYAERCFLQRFYEDG